MDGLDIFALIVLLVIGGVAVLLAVVLGGLPGKIARQRNHPQGDAIAVCGWLGLVTGILWAVALVWAFWRSLGGETQPTGGELAKLKRTIQQLEERVAALDLAEVNRELERLGLEILDPEDQSTPLTSE